MRQRPSTLPTPHPPPPLRQAVGEGGGGVDGAKGFVRPRRQIGCVSPAESPTLGPRPPIGRRSGQPGAVERSTAGNSPTCGPRRGSAPVQSGRGGGAEGGGGGARRQRFSPRRQTQPSRLSAGPPRPRPAFARRRATHTGFCRCGAHTRHLGARTTDGRRRSAECPPPRRVSRRQLWRAPPPPPKPPPPSS